MEPLALSLLTLLAAPPETASDANAAFFDEKVRPLLEARCFRCHSAEAGKAKGGLRLDGRDAVLKGGDSGLAVVPGKPEASRLVRALSHKDPDLEMPPDERLPDGEIDVLTRWVALGAPWSTRAARDGGSVAGAAPKKEKVITDADRAWWAFRPLREPAAPNVRSGRNAARAVARGAVRNDIDRFVLAALRANGLEPAPEASRGVLIRRLTFDLHGLPPTPEEVIAFERDARPDAYERLVDRLLASPRYGERWARTWMDLVRYAESDGHRQDAYRPETWPYRDYLIRSFNEDKPYDRFVLEQLAGDEVAPDDPSVVVATGFLRLGPYEFNQRDVRRQWSEILNELTDVTGDVFLGLGMACARCHDHKFDPIRQREYFALQAFFTPILWRDDRRLATAADEGAYRATLAAWEQKTAAARAELRAVERPFLEKADESAITRFPPDIERMLRQPIAELPPLDRQLAELAFRQVVYERERIDGQIKGAERDRWSALKKKLAAMGPPPAPPLRAFVVSDVGPVAPETRIPGAARGEPIAPGFPAILDPPAIRVGAGGLRPPEPVAGGPGDPVRVPIIDISPPDLAPASTGRRTALARWIGSQQNPLPARVMMNRIWQRLFGRGLVATSGDFGRLGEPPSHPELLEWLTARFLAAGMRPKALERLIVTSAAYRRASRHPRSGRAARVDPENRLLWRQNVRRLEAEQVRDALLAASGDLDLAASGGAASEPSAPRRSIYTKVLRNTRDPLLAAFDAADGLVSTSQRNVTTTAAQALLLLHGPFARRRAEGLAARVFAEAPDDRGRVERAFRWAFGRPPSGAESVRSLAFLRAGPEPAAAAPADAELGTETMPHRGGKALRVRPDRAADRWRAGGIANAPGAGFAIEAVARLDSVAPDGAARVVASLAPDRGAGAALALGVSGDGGPKGGRELMLILRPRGREPVEIGSDLRVELHKAYYVAAAVEPAAASRSERAIKFLVRDLSDPDAPLRRGAVSAPLGEDLAFTGALILGGEASEGGSGWDGLVDEVRLSRALGAGETLAEDGTARDVLGHFKLEPEPGPRRDSAGKLHDLEPVNASSGAARSRRPGGPPPALVDLCHALFNANELIYVD